VNRRHWLGLLAIAIAVGGALGGWYASRKAERVSVDAAREERRHAQRERAEAWLARLTEESAALMPEPLRGIALGMSLDEVRRARARRLIPSTQRGETTLLVFEEQLSNGGRVMYGFDPTSQRLVQVQVLSLLPTLDAIAPHLRAMHERYGRPTGIWDCPSTGGVPTRRFTWRGSTTTVSDVFLVYGNRVSLTLYIATSDQIGRSLAMAHCEPVPPHRIDAFPIATPEQIRRAAAPSSPPR
jgi:hypothetical protein